MSINAFQVVTKRTRMMRRLIVMCMTLVLVSCASGADTSVNQQSSSTQIVTATPALLPTAQPEATQTAEPTIEPTPLATETPVPFTGIDALTMFVQMPMNIVWSDTFDKLDSGWEPRYEVIDSQKKPSNLPAYLTVPYNGYVNGAYEFYVKTATDNNYVFNIPENLRAIHAPIMWDFNNVQSLPAYPYTVLAEMDAIRDTHAVLFGDYQGNFSNIDAASGIMVIVTLRDTKSTLGAEFEESHQAVFSVYEMRPRQLWSLNCSATGTWPNVRRALLAMHVDQDVVRVELASAAQRDQRITQTCRRIQPSLSDTPRYLGMGAVYTNPLELPTMRDEGALGKELRAPGLLRFDTIVVGQRTTPILVDGALKNPEPIAAYRCINQYPWILPSEVLGVIHGVDINMCDPSVGAPDIPPIMVAPYDDNEVAALLGTWQCGSDLENRLTISQQGDTLQLANADISRKLVSVTHDQYPKREKYYITVDASSTLVVGDRMWPNLRMWQSYREEASLIMTYRNDQLNTNWAGACSRVE
jgi:hypothetical protein